MPIECYLSQCPKHCTNDVPPDDGPFCYEDDCVATAEQIKGWKREIVGRARIPGITTHRAPPQPNL